VREEQNSWEHGRNGNRFQRTVITWRSGWKSGQSRHVWRWCSHLQWQQLELLQLRQCLLWLMSCYILVERLESVDC
jgi:hypothetical protein